MLMLITKGAGAGWELRMFALQLRGQDEINKRQCYSCTFYYTYTGGV